MTITCNLFTITLKIFALKETIIVTAADKLSPLNFDIIPLQLFAFFRSTLINSFRNREN